MNLPRNLAPLASLALAITLSLGGCKSTTTTPAAGQNAQQPAATQPSATQPAATQPTAAQPATAAAPADPGYAPAPAPKAPPQPVAVDLPAGSNIRVRLDQDLGSKISQPGDNFNATVASDVLVNGEVIVPRGARADGAVIDARPLGKFKGGALLSIRLERVVTKWGSYPVATRTVSRVEQGKGKRSTGFIAGGAGLGALIGGLAGGGKGAAIGALAGGGAGTAGAAFTGNKQIFLPAESLLTFKLERTVHVVQ